MYKWLCLSCGRTVWNAKTCSCGNTMEQNAKLHEEREIQKKIDRIRGRK